jgi:hypothetical protein
MALQYTETDAVFRPCLSVKQYKGYYTCRPRSYDYESLSRSTSTTCFFEGSRLLYNQIAMTNRQSWSSCSYRQAAEFSESKVGSMLHDYFCSQVVHQPSLIRVKEWHQCFKGRTTNSGQGVYLLRLTRFIFWFLFQLLVRIVFLLGKKYGKLMLNTLSFFPSNSGIQGAQGLINS